MVKLLDGRALADKIKHRLSKQAESFPLKPGVAYLAFGEDPASVKYISAVQKACREVGFFFQMEKFPIDISPGEFLRRLEEFNRHQEIHGILIQAPFPPQLNPQEVCKKISPQKDLDGIHPLNQGFLYSDAPVFIPCTAKAVLYLLKEHDIKMAGRFVVIIGRSLAVGKPLAHLFLHENATVTVCHRKTVEIKRMTRMADILVVSAGSPRLVERDWVSSGAAVIDVGIHAADGKLVGDVDASSVSETASWLSPVPGGVGPVTTACLLENAFQAFQQLNPSIFSADKGKKEGEMRKSLMLDGKMNPLNQVFENKGDERRQYRRLNHHLEVRYYISANSTPIKVYTEDISVGGIRVKNPFPINEHYQFPMRITLKPETNLTVKAIVKVAWQKPTNSEWSIGLEFIHIEDSDRKIIQDFIEEAQ